MSRLDDKKLPFWGRDLMAEAGFAEPDLFPESKKAPELPLGSPLLRVLIVDQDADCAQSLATLTGLWGHQARIAHDGLAALASAAIEPPDVVIADIALPLMNGYNLAKALRRQPGLKTLLLIAVTGYGDNAHRLLCREAGFNLFLVKPVRPQTLESLLLFARDRLGAPLDAIAPSWAYGILAADQEQRNGLLASRSEATCAAVAVPIQRVAFRSVGHCN